MIVLLYLLTELIYINKMRLAKLISLYKILGYFNQSVLCSFVWGTVVIQWVPKDSTLMVNQMMIQPSQHKKIWFLKDHMALKTGVIADKMSALYIIL